MFKQSAPIIKLARRCYRGRPSRPARLAQQFDSVLLDEAGLPDKGSGGIGRGIDDEQWETFYELDWNSV